MFAGLAWGAGYAESIPNFEFLTVITFAGGWVVGPAWGAVAGALAAFLFSAINPYGSGLAVPLVLVAQMIGLALAGAAGGFVARIAPVGQWVRAALVVAAGIAVTIVYDLLTNVASGVTFGQTGAILVAGIPFALIHVGTNAVLFATVGTALAGALERTRRSLALAVLVAACLGAAAALTLVPARPARAQATAEPPAVPSIAPPAKVDTTATVDTLGRREAGAPPDSGSAAWQARRDSALARSRAWRTTVLPSPPAWGEGGATMFRRDDVELSTTLTREAGFGERFADDRGSAEPLARFGLPGADVHVSWFGLPSATLGARSAEIGRVPWPAIGAYEAPRLPVSAREAFRGEGGEARLESWPSVRGHPRVLAWARTGSSGSNRSGFLAAAGNGVLDGTLVVASQSARGLQPLGPSGDHMIAGQGTWRPGAWSVTGALRSGRTGIEDISERTERRAGEALRFALARRLGRVDLELEAERSDEKLDYARDAIEFVSTRGRSDRARITATVPGGAGETFASLTLGHERLRSDADPAIETLEADLYWGAIGRSARLAPGWRAEAIVGAGKYHDDEAQIAPSALLEHDLRPGTTVWAGVARGLGGSIEPVSVDTPGDTLRFDPAHVASSLWLAGIGATLRSEAERDPRNHHGPAPKGAYRARAAAYLGERDPGADAVRTLFAGSSVLAGPFEEVGAPTRFFALTGTGAWAPVEGVKLEAGGHALAREVDAALLPSDPEWRTFASVEGRQRWLHEDLDLRGGVTFELVGARAGTPAGDLPTMTRVGLFAGVMLDDFDLRAELRNAAGSNRLLPVIDDFGSGPIRAEESRFLIELRWTFWD